MNKKKKKKGIHKLERNMYKFFILTIVLLVITIVLSEAMLGKINLEVQELNKKVKEETEEKQSLMMKISEMVSLDKIQKISSEQGLTYNNENIKQVTE